MARAWVGWGALNAMFAVAAGAFGAHALKSRLSPEMLAVFETAARYQMFHALGLILVGALASSIREINPVGWAFLAGIVLFSGSLYVLALSGVKTFGAVTPFGGLSFLFGWALLAWRAFRS